MINQANDKYMKKLIKNEEILLLGSAPNVCNITAEQMEKFSLICRVNNYKIFNECMRTDIFYSYHGNSIIKTARELRGAGCRLVMGKCPLADYTQRTNGEEKQGHTFNGLEIYQSKAGFFQELESFNIPVKIQSVDQFDKNYFILNRILTTGVSAMLDLLQWRAYSVTIAGFDFFESQRHNVDEAWITGDGNHDIRGEREIVKYLIKNRMVYTLGMDGVMQ